MVASMAESFLLPFSITVMEVIAAKKALQFAKDLELSSIILKGDSKIAIDGLKSKDISLAEYRHLLDEAKEIAALLEVVKFNYMQRQANKLVHNIARHARHVSEFLV